MSWDDTGWVSAGVYRAVTPDGTLWCESSDREQVERMSEGQDVRIYTLFRREQQYWRDEQAIEAWEKLRP